MTREQFERALRRRLEEFHVKHEYKWWRIPAPVISKLIAKLLPWFWEVLESTEAETKEACGQLP